MEKLDAASSTPLYQQLRETLLAQIEQGSIPAGSRLPTETELSQQYQISRITVRKALKSLEQDGYLIRKVGKGTFLREDKMIRKLSTVLSFTDMCQRLGYKPGAKTIRVTLDDPTPSDAENLGIRETDKVLVIERIRYANDQPIMLETAKFTEDFFFLFDEELSNASLYEVIRERRGIQFTNSVKRLEIVFANYQESKYLGISLGYPLLKISSVVSDATGKYRQISRQRCIADKFEMIV